MTPQILPPDKETEEMAIRQMCAVCSSVHVCVYYSACMCMPHIYSYACVWLQFCSRKNAMNARSASFCIRFTKMLTLLASSSLWKSHPLYKQVQSYVSHCYILSKASKYRFETCALPKQLSFSNTNSVISGPSFTSLGRFGAWFEFVRLNGDFCWCFNQGNKTAITASIQ